MAWPFPWPFYRRDLFCVWQEHPTPETCLGPSHPPCQQPTSCRLCMPSPLSYRDWPWSSSGYMDTPTCMAATYQVRKIITGEAGRGGRARWPGTGPHLPQPNGCPSWLCPCALPSSASTRLLSLVPLGPGLWTSGSRGPGRIEGRTGPAVREAVGAFRP